MAFKLRGTIGRLTLATLLMAAWTSAVAQALPLKYHQHADGLTNTAVTALTVDNQERLWIGTENGLFRNDGDHVNPVALPGTDLVGRTVSALVPDSSPPRPASGCSVWVGTETALWRFCAGTWVEVSDGGKPIPVDDGLALAEDGPGAVLVVSRGKLLRVQADGKAFAHDPAGISVRHLAPDTPPLRFFSVLRASPKHWWSGCGTGLCEWQEGRLLRHGARQGVPAGRWAGLLKARDGSIWARSDRAVIRLAPGGERFEDVTPSGLSHGTVHIQLPMLEDADSRILVHTDDGLMRTRKGVPVAWQHFGASENLSVGGGIHAMAFDSAGDLWLGTAGHGLAHWRGYRHWASWTRTQGLPSDEAWSFLSDADGGTWIGTGAGPALLDARGLRTFPGPAPSRHQIGGMVRDAAGRLWATTYSGHVLRLGQDRRTPAWTPVGETPSLIYGLVGVPDDRLLVGTRTGLFEVRGATTAAPSLQRVALPAAAADADVRAMCVEAGGDAVWMATDKGLWQRLASGEIVKPVVEGLPEKPLVTLACAKAELWLTMFDGSLWQLQHVGAAWHARQLSSATLGRRRVVSLLVDHADRLWLGTDDGLVVRTAHGDWRRFDDSNGLVWGDTNGYALHEDSSGRIWVGTSRGVSRIDDASALLETGSMPFALDDVRQGDRSWRTDAPVSVPWSREPLEIRWQVPGFTNRDSTIIRYRLDGERQPWIQADRSRLRFDELPAGPHHLEVFAENTDLGRRSESVNLDLAILPPWWWSRAAQASYGAALLGCLWVAFRWRVRRLVGRQAELEGQVRQRTQELEASHEAMRTLALTDMLTGIMNRRAVLEGAQRELERVRRHEGPLMLALVDIDHFKRVNDTLGHPVGDDVLRQVAARLRSGMRQYDLLGRYGGEEFLVVMPGLHIDHDDADRRLRALRESVGGTPFVLESGAELSITCSMGVVAAAAGEDVPLATLIDAADRALYRAKENGRNRVETTAWIREAAGTEGVAS